MKKIICLLLVLCCVISLCACSSSVGNSSKSLIDKLSGAPSIPEVKKALGENYRDGDSDEPYYEGDNTLYQLYYDNVDYLGYSGLLLLKYGRIWDTSLKSYTDRDNSVLNEYYWIYEKGSNNNEQFEAAFDTLLNNLTEKFGEPYSDLRFLGLGVQWKMRIADSDSSNTSVYLFNESFNEKQCIVVHYTFDDRLVELEGIVANKKFEEETSSIVLPRYIKFFEDKQMQYYKMRFSEDELLYEGSYYSIFRGGLPTLVFSPNLWEATYINVFFDDDNSVSSIKIGSNTFNKVDYIH